MYEIPEANAVARQLACVRGRTIASAKAGASPHKFAFFAGDPSAYGEKLNGKAIGGARAQGGWVELECGDTRLLFGDGASIRILTPDAPEPAKHQLFLRLDDGSALYATIGMYGAILALDDDGSDYPYYIVAKEKVSPLSPDFDRAYFQTLCDGVKPTTSAKALLATQQRIPGLGNGCVQDILFRAGIHPKRKLHAIGDDELDRLFDVLKSTLAAMTEAGGRDTEKDIYGKPGGYQTALSAKTYAFPCPACGGAISREAYLGGNVYFCAHCQAL